MAILGSAYRGGALLYLLLDHFTLSYAIHLYTLKISLKLHVYVLKNIWLNYANAYVNISSRFSTTYLSTGGPWPPLKSPMSVINGQKILVSPYNIYGCDTPLSPDPTLSISLSTCYFKWYIP